MKNKIEEIYEFVCDDSFLDVIDKRYRDIADEIYYKVFKGEKTGFSNISWNVTIDGIIRFEYNNLINHINDENKEKLVDEYFKNLPNRREEIITIAKLLDEYSDMKVKSELTVNEDDDYYFSIIDDDDPVF